MSNYERKQKLLAAVKTFLAIEGLPRPRDPYFDTDEWEFSAAWGDIEVTIYECAATLFTKEGVRTYTEVSKFQEAVKGLNLENENSRWLDKLTIDS